jgi:hypothetical protein
MNDDFAVGQRVRAIHFGSKPVPTGGSVDPKTGLIRDAAGAVISVDDNYTVPAGTEGIIDDIDDAGTFHVRWDNGCLLGLLPGKDRFDRA